LQANERYGTTFRVLKVTFQVATPEAESAVYDIYVVFLRFLFWSRFYVLNVFLFSKHFFIFKDVDKVQSGKQI